MAWPRSRAFHQDCGRAAMLFDVLLAARPRSLMFYWPRGRAYDVLSGRAAALQPLELQELPEENRNSKKQTTTTEAKLPKLCKNGIPGKVTWGS